MKRTINGKTYNTETAVLLETWSNDEYGTSLDYVEESLYKTPSGEYFVVGDGGPRTIHSKKELDGRVGATRFYVLTEAEADAWRHTHNLLRIFEDRDV